MSRISFHEVMLNYDKLLPPVPILFERLISASRGFTGRAVITLTPEEMERFLRICASRGFEDIDCSHALETSLGTILKTQAAKDPVENFHRVTRHTIVVVAGGENYENYIAVLPIS